MKKIGMGISILLFDCVLALFSSGMEMVVLAVGAVGLIGSIVGYLEK